MSSESLKLKNVMEEIVLEIAEEWLAKMDICQCEQCKLDIMALALSSLKPKYSVSKRGEVLIKANMMEKQAQADVLAAFAKAAKIVKRNPRHRKNQ